MTYACGLDLRPRLPPTTGVPKCSGWVRGSWSRVSLSAKCLPLFRHRDVRRSVVMSPSSKTEIFVLEILGWLKWVKSFTNIKFPSNLHPILPSMINHLQYNHKIYNNNIKVNTLIIRPVKPASQLLSHYKLHLSN